MITVNFVAARDSIPTRGSQTEADQKSAQVSRTSPTVGEVMTAPPTRSRNMEPQSDQSYDDEQAHLTRDCDHRDSSCTSASRNQGSGERSEKSLRERASNHVLASDTVMIDIVGPGWHGTSAIEERTQAARVGFPWGYASEGFVRNIAQEDGDGWGALIENGTEEVKVKEVEGELKVAIVSNNLEGHSQNKAFEKLCHLLPRSK